MPMDKVITAVLMTLFPARYDSATFIISLDNMRLRELTGPQL